MKRPLNAAQRASYRARVLKRLKRMKVLAPNSDFQLEQLQRAADPGFKLVRCKDGILRRFKTRKKGDPIEEIVNRLNKPEGTKMVRMRNGQTRRVPAWWNTK